MTTFAPHPKITRLSDISEPTLVEVKTWLEPWLRRMVAAALTGFIRFNFDNQGGYLDIQANAADASGYGVHINDDSGDNGMLIEAEEKITLQQNDGLLGIIINDGFSGITLNAGAAGFHSDTEFQWFLNHLARFTVIDHLSVDLLSVEDDPRAVVVGGSVLIDAGGNRVTNGADGVDPTDLATVEQLTSGTVEEVTSDDASVVVTNPNGPIVDLSVTVPPSGIQFDTPNVGGSLEVETNGVGGTGWGIDIQDTGGNGIQVLATGAQINVESDSQIQLLSGGSVVYVGGGYVQNTLGPAGLFQVLSSVLLPLVTVSEATGVTSCLGIHANPITAGVLPTVAPASGTAFQCDTGRDVHLVVPITFNPTALLTATCTVALSPDNSTFSTLATKTLPALAAIAGLIDDVSLHVPAGWWVKLTVSSATLGTGTYY